MARTTIIEQMVTEGQRTSSDASPDGTEPSETRGSYGIDLVRAALILNDPRALEGMVWLGLQTDGDAVPFIAAAGEPAIPFLEQAWSADSFRRPAVLEAATTLLDLHQELSGPSRIRLVRIQMDASGFEWALESSVLDHPEFAASVAFTADSGGDEVQRSTARGVLPSLLSRVMSASPAKLWARERLFTEAACNEEDRGRCEELQNLWEVVDGHIQGSRWIPAKNVLDSFLRAASVMCTDPERASICHSLIGNAQIVASKVSRLARH